jgi:hypothetical protein
MHYPRPKRALQFSFQKILNARKGQISLMDQNDAIDDHVLSVIEKGLFARDMGRQINDSFKDRLRTELDEECTVKARKRARSITITSREVDTSTRK